MSRPRLPSICALALSSAIACSEDRLAQVEHRPDGEPRDGAIQRDDGGLGDGGLPRDGGVAPDGGLAPDGGGSLDAGRFDALQVDPRELVATGYAHTCAIRPSDGSLVCWGEDTFGQASPPSGAFVAVAAGFRYSCALGTDGEARCWGDTQGAGSIDAQTPNGVCRTNCENGARDLLSCTTDDDCRAGPLVRLGASVAHSCGLNAAGSLRCWKRANSCFSLPGCVEPTGRFVQLSVKRFHTCGVRDDGSVECWGRGTTVTPGCDNNGHECGQAIAPAGVFTEVSVGFFHTCALRPDRSVECWGTGNNGTSESWQDYGQARPPPGIRLAMLAAGGLHTCGLEMDGRVRCWGRDDPSRVVSTAPAGTFVSLVCGEDHCCARAASGALTCWGANHLGQATVPASYP